MQFSQCLYGFAGFYKRVNKNIFKKVLTTYCYSSMIGTSTGERSGNYDSSTMQDVNTAQALVSRQQESTEIRHKYYSGTCQQIISGISKPISIEPFPEVWDILLVDSNGFRFYRGERRFRQQEMTGQGIKNHLVKMQDGGSRWAMTNISVRYATINNFVNHFYCDSR